MKTIFRYPLKGEPDTVHFDVTDKRPSQEEAVKLTNIPIEKKPVSKEELTDALKWLAVGTIMGVFAWFFGRWVIENFRGLGVLFFGYGFAYIGMPASIIFEIINLSKLFRSAQKKNPKDALRWVYETSFLGEDGVGTRFGKLDYAVATLERIVPYAIGFDSNASRSYITDFRNTLTRAMEKTTAPARKEAPGNWAEGGAQKLLTIDDTKELYPGVLEISATLTYKDILTRSDNDNTVNVISAVLELHIVSIFINSGEYWYPYDIFPAVTCRE